MAQSHPDLILIPLILSVFLPSADRRHFAAVYRETMRRMCAAKGLFRQRHHGLPAARTTAGRVMNLPLNDMSAVIKVTAPESGTTFPSTNPHLRRGQGGCDRAAIARRHVRRGLDRRCRLWPHQHHLNSGFEMNAKVCKMVRQIAARHRGGGKWKILYRQRGHHGTITGTLAASGQPQQAEQDGPYPGSFVIVPYCLECRRRWDVEDYGPRAADAIEEVIPRKGPETAGAIVPPAGDWPRLQEICRAYGILLDIGEVVCGLSRAGTCFGNQHDGIEPDFVTMAKGVASGHAAISGTVTTKAVFDIFKDARDDATSHFRDMPTSVGCTSGPVAALETIRIVEDEDLPANTTRMDDRLLINLRALKGRHAAIGEGRARGFSAGQNWSPIAPPRNHWTRGACRRWSPAAWHRASSSERPTTACRD